MDNNNKSVYYKLKVRKNQIGDISSFLDGIDGIGYSTTITPEDGIIEICCSITQEKYLKEFIDDLINWVKFKIIDKSYD
jgi:hypothetical protein